MFFIAPLFDDTKVEGGHREASWTGRGSDLSLFPGKRSEIPLPYGTMRAMKDALMPLH
jgi:hypothetical protein